MEVFKIFGTLGLRDNEYRTGLSRAEQQGQRTSRSINNGFKNTGSIFKGVGGAALGMGAAVAGVTGIAFGVASAITNVVSAGASYEEQMSKVKAISGASGKEFEMLKAQAKQLGSDTKYSATEAAEGMEFLARAGFKTGDIMKAMPGMLDLAAAGALDLGRAADISSNIMSGFGIEAGKAGHVSDVLAKAAASANTDVSQLGEAMKYLAPTAKSVGWSMEESTAAVMALSDAGIQGSMAGQAFGSSLTRLADPTKKMRKVMEKLNLSFFDHNGVMKPLPQLVSEIKDKTKHLTKEQQAAALSTLFGAEAYKHWSVLIEKGGQALGENTEMLKNADGAAKKMANTMNQNLAGAWKGFQSKLETLSITIFEKLSPALQSIVNFGSDVVSSFTKMISGSNDFTKGFSKAFAGIGNAAANLKNVMTNHFSGMMEMFQKHKGTLLKIWNTLWGEIGPPVVKALKLIGSIINTFLSVFRETVNLFMSLISGDWKGAWESLKTLTSDLIKGLGDIIQILWDGSVLQKLVQAIKKGAIQIGNALLEWGVAIKDWFMNLPENTSQWLSYWGSVIGSWYSEKKAEWKTKLDEWGAVIKEWFSSLPEVISQKLSEWWTSIGNWFESTKESWKTKLDGWNVAIGEWFEKLPENIYNWLLSVSQKLEQWNNEQIEKIKEDFNGWWLAIEEWFNSTKERWKTKLDEWGTSISDWWNSLPEKISNWFINWWTSIENWYNTTKTNIENKLNQWGESISNWFNTRPGEIKNSLGNWWSSMSKWWDETKTNIQNKLEGWWQTIKNWFNQVPNKPEIKNAGKNMIDKMAEGANSKEGDFTEKLGKLILKVIGLTLLAIAVGLFSAGKELIKLILKGVDAAIGWVVQKFKEVGKTGIDSIKSIDWMGLGKDLIKWIIDGIVSMGGALGRAFTKLFKSIRIPTPKFSVSGSLNPMDWISSGSLPSVSVKWAAKGALVKPGSPTLIGVGDAKGYDEAVLPLRDSTLGRIGKEIAQTMPRTSQQQANRPIELVVNLDKREIAREIYTDVQKFSQREEDIRKAF
ncbi:MULTISPECIES: phage tail tape measure protein [unclassified Bacillus cereus group]|uniref:phage tail tape measure protein n=1 Tax=unclassified Bacillus cereus group TaxID=2750818 RepID=UPI001F58BDA8|nr:MULTISPECIES: phage tail tape measure protein [unclassified Bacillus cereus group]